MVYCAVKDGDMVCCGFICLSSCLGFAGVDFMLYVVIHQSFKQFATIACKSDASFWATLALVSLGFMVWRNICFVISLVFMYISLGILSGPVLLLRLSIFML